MRQFRELLHMIDDRPIGWRSIDGHENSFVHVRPLYPPTMTCHAERSESGSPQISRAVIKIALPQRPAINSHPLFHLPISAPELVKCRSGNMANGSCSASTTCLRVSKSLTQASPRTPIIKTAEI